jgi:hypothetical protein
MDDAPKKRPWLQFSLATAIVMMVVAGMWLPIVIWAVSNSAQDLERGLDDWPVPLLMVVGLYAAVVVAAGVATESYIRRRERRP